MPRRSANSGSSWAKLIPCGGGSARYVRLGALQAERLGHRAEAPEIEGPASERRFSGGWAAVGIVVLSLPAKKYK